MNDAELGWLAGLFEGEGSVGLSRRSTGQVAAKAQLYMTDEDVVRRFHSLLGIGSLYTRQLKSLCVGGNLRQLQWCWSIDGQQDVLNFCALLQPHMSKRRAEKMAEVINYLVPHV